jgi:thiol-disulfide isomerase/thioredoxin
MKNGITLFILALSLQSLFAQEGRKIETLPVGAQAPGFNLPGVDGKNYTLEDFGEYEFLVVVFTCNHCPTAQAYENRIIQAVNDYKEKGVGFVAISPNSPAALSLSELGYSDLGDDLEDMKIRARGKEFNFPYLYDGDTQEVSMAYGPVATPHVFIFDRERRLRYAGRIDDTENPYIDIGENNMRDALNALIDGRPVEVEKTKTFGCSVKWSWADSWKKKLLEDWKNAPVSLDEIDIEGVKELVANNSGKLRLINVWATWCGPCVIEFPEFIAIDRMYRGRDFEFISISADKPDKKDRALEFLKKQEAANKNLIFSGKSVYDLVEAVDPGWQGALPYTLLVAPGGERVLQVQGPITPLAVKQKIVGYLGKYYADDK